VERGRILLVWRLRPALLLLSLTTLSMKLDTALCCMCIHSRGFHLPTSVSRRIAQWSWPFDGNRKVINILSGQGYSRFDEELIHMIRFLIIRFEPCNRGITFPWLSTMHCSVDCWPCQKTSLCLRTEEEHNEEHNFSSANKMLRILGRIPNRLTTGYMAKKRWWRSTMTNSLRLLILIISVDLDVISIWDQHN
jgi:hypothetical protein